MIKIILWSSRMEEPMNNDPYLVTIKQAANRLGIQYRQLLDAANAGEIPYYKIGKSRRLVSVSEILDCIKHSQKETKI